MEARPSPFELAIPRAPWPLVFDDYSLDTRCYNTLACSIIYARHQLVSPKNLGSPSGQPHRPDWKDQWHGNFSTYDFDTRGFPSTVEFRWKALDGIQREAEIDLDDVFPGHQIKHQVPREAVDEDWASTMRKSADILMEVNDRTINVYTRAKVLGKQEIDPEHRPGKRVAYYSLMLAWTRTY